ncbi:hypothetical protein GCM10027174_38740 [Salinifilum aidingensis]
MTWLAFPLPRVGAAGAGRRRARRSTVGSMVRVLTSVRIGRVTGEESRNRTASRFGVTATDLGIPWRSADGGMLVAFGDTYGSGWGGYGAGPRTADWRCNVLARSGAADPGAGLRLDWMLPRGDGAAGQVLAPDREVRAATIIPTSGISVDGREYLHYMSVRCWGVPGVWHTNYAGLAFSEDGGRTWTKSRTAVWPNRKQRTLDRLRRRDQGGHPFQMVGFAGVVDGWVYLLGTPSGRFGAAHLAAVPAEDLLQARAYRYWTGDGWGEDPYRAAALLPAPVGEVSVGFHDYLGVWLATHLDEHRAAIVLRSAPELTGPWSAGEVAVAGFDYPALYGGFQCPWPRDRPALYFTLTQWGPYNVDLFRADLVG